MTKEETSSVKTTDQVKTRGPRDRHQKKDKPKPLTKVIIRRLPPTMTEEEFLKQIDPLPEHDNYYYAAADWSLGFDATCRAYITFKNHEDIFLFRDRFDGYVFVDTKGEEYPAIVEFAPFQGLPKNKARKTDPKVGTIESEQHYISFLQKLEEDREACKSECKLEFSLQPKDDKKVTSTPLLQFLMNKKMERREEQKKRTEDNRRKREEEKQKRRNRVSKGIPSAIKEEGGTSSKDTKPKTEGGGGGTADHPEEKKNSRAKRRAERDQRRREEHEQRRREKEKERLAEQQNEQKTGKTSSTSDQQPAKEPEKTPAPITITKQPPEGEVNKRKEVKKYSERRERNRNKNSQQNTTSSVSNESTNPASSDVKPVKENKTIVKEDNAMMSFMKNISNVKEFVPKHKQEEAAAAKQGENLKANKSSNAPVDMEEVKEKLEKMSLKNKDKVVLQKTVSQEKDDEPAAAAEPKASERTERSHRNSSSSGGYPNETKSEDRKERRIRNKDRPSIMIYQPGKSRLRSTDDGQPILDTKSNPTSDTESLKKEERSNTGRKVSRYSERRSGRARDGKRRSSEDITTTKKIETPTGSNDLKKDTEVKPVEEKIKPEEKIVEKLEKVEKIVEKEEKAIEKETE